jgi:hypothetical protein
MQEIGQRVLVVHVGDCDDGAGDQARGSVHADVKGTFARLGVDLDAAVVDLGRQPPRQRPRERVAVALARFDFADTLPAGRRVHLRATPGKCVALSASHVWEQTPDLPNAATMRCRVCSAMVPATRPRTRPQRPLPNRRAVATQPNGQLTLPRSL